MGSSPAGIAFLRKGSPARNKLLFIFGGLIIIGTASVFASATLQALRIRSVTSSEFNKYVIQNHIGTAQETEDESGIEGDFCTLLLNHPLPSKTLQKSVVNLLYHYHNLDGGTNLEIDEHVPGSTKVNVVADTIYDQTSQTVSVNLHNASNDRVIKVHVNWTDAWYSN
jgi:hypothetical protein